MTDRVQCGREFRKYHLPALSERRINVAPKILLLSAILFVMMWLPNIELTQVAGKPDLYHFTCKPRLSLTLPLGLPCLLVNRALL